MADMPVIQPTRAASNLILVSGERLQVKVLKSDGTEKETIMDFSVPLGKSFQGGISYSGELVSA